MQSQRNPDAVNFPPFETDDLRRNLKDFLESTFVDQATGTEFKIGSFTWGVYAFYDYDGEPIYVGQTKERLGTRIRRHLTNQRTDAVAMSVLDPFEVFEIEVWPLPQFENTPKRPANNAALANAAAHLNALEHSVYLQAIASSEFKAILNEKNPPPPTITVEIPVSFKQRIVSDEVYRIRSHPDFRVARRALIISRLAQVISERQVQGGLRRVLATQAKRLLWLADRRFAALGGDKTVVVDDGHDEELDPDE